MNVLISGLCIAGPTLAFWLSKYGFARRWFIARPLCKPPGM
jgi:hypothetical protein